jgi:hypothetical protein
MRAFLFHVNIVWLSSPHQTAPNHPMPPNPQPYFTQLVDPRRETRNKLHALPDIVMITLCGYDDWVSIEDFAHESEAWLRQFLPLANGILYHDTLSDVMGSNR